ncbi:hypothetical protein MIR68_000423 [Amoeboaphelidium protococcarum]|nr:hypothetical protein MIR68_000423 [Amoeboaphelidium protococcarum]
MGRKKIAIKRIPDARRRHVTFSRRKVGLMKKAYELSVLCGCDVGLVMISADKVTLYSNKSMDQIIHKYNDVVQCNPDDVEQFFDQDLAGMVDNGDMADNFDDDDFGSTARENAIAAGEDEVASQVEKKPAKKKRASKRGSVSMAPDEGNKEYGSNNLNSEPSYHAHFSNLHRTMVPFGMQSNDDIAKVNGMINAGYYQQHLATSNQSGASSSNSGNAPNQSGFTNPYMNYPPYYIFHPYSLNQNDTLHAHVPSASPNDISRPSISSFGDSTPQLAAIVNNHKNAVMMISPSGSTSHLPGLPPFNFAHSMLPDMSSSNNSLMIMAHAASNENLKSERDSDNTEQKSHQSDLQNSGHDDK